MFLLGKSIFIPGPFFSQLCSFLPECNISAVFFWGGREDLKFEQGGPNVQGMDCDCRYMGRYYEFTIKIYHVLDEQNLYSQSVQYQIIYICVIPSNTIVDTSKSTIIHLHDTPKNEDHEMILLMKDILHNWDV